MSSAPSTMVDDGGTTAALLGATSAGSQVALVLYGLSLAFVGRWATNEGRGAETRVKLLHASVFVFLTAYTILIFVDSTYWTTTSKRTTTDVRQGWTGDAVLPLLAALVQVPVQTVLALRATAFMPRGLYRSAFLGAVFVLLALSLVGAILSCVSGVLYRRSNIESISFLNFDDALILWLSAAALASIAITAALSSTLRNRSGGFDRKSDSFVRKILGGAYRTGAFTTLLAVIAAATALAYQSNDSPLAFVDWAFWLPLPASYSLSLYSTQPIRPSFKHHLPSTPSLPLTSVIPQFPSDTSVVVPVADLEEDKPRNPYPHSLHHKPPPRNSGIFDKIETWERRASVDDVRLGVPGQLRRSSSFDLRAMSHRHRTGDIAEEGDRRPADGGRRDSSVIDFQREDEGR